MSTVEFEPVVLVPISSEPIAPIVLTGKNALSSHSKLFPIDQPENLTGGLGNYSGGMPPPGSPIANLIGGLKARKAQIHEQEKASDGQRTVETYSGLLATAMQIHLGRCIDRGYRNLREKNWPTRDAITVVSSFIESQDNAQFAKLSADMQTLTTRVDQSSEVTDAESSGRDYIPIFDRRGGKLFQSLTPKQSRMVHQEFLHSEIANVNLEFAKLRFEWLSAVAIVKILKMSDRTGRGRRIYERTPDL